MSELRMSVVICTHNRSKHLANCLESMKNQDMDVRLFEIIVVDNGSSDDTKKVCRRFQDNPNFRYVLEPCLGLSHARNRGVKESRSPVVAFTDDDAILDTGWVSNLINAFNDTTVAAAGGPILPIFEELLPNWFDSSLLPLYSCRDRGGEIMDLEAGQFFYGTNMAIKKEIVIEVGGFLTGLGRKGKRLLSDEELALFNEIEKAGYKKRYMPKCIVYHVISKERLRITWLMRRFYWLGRGEGIRRRDHARRVRASVKKKWIRRMIRDLVRPRYKAGLYTRLIPFVVFLGCVNSVILANKRCHAG